MNRPFVIPLDFGGALSADETFEFITPFGMSLHHVSAVASNDSDATLKIGHASDDDAYMVATAIGDSGAYTRYDRDDFVGDQFPHIAGGTTIVVTLDYDGASGTAAQNAEICVTFTEG